MKPVQILGREAALVLDQFAKVKTQPHKPSGLRTTTPFKPKKRDGGRPSVHWKDNTR